MAFSTIPTPLAFLVLLAAAAPTTAAQDWLLDSSPYPARLRESADGRTLHLENGLVRRSFRLDPAAVCIALDDLSNDRSVLRAVEAEAELLLDGTRYPVGGRGEQPDRAYLRPEWLEAMPPLPNAFRLIGHQTAPLRARFPWLRVRHAQELPWPPPGIELQLHFAAPPGPHAGVEVTVHHAIYSGLPLVAKWITVRNGGATPVELEGFTSELLSAVEYESDVEPRASWDHPNLHVETDYAMGGFSPRSAIQPARWLPDPGYLTQVNYQRMTPNRLVVAPPLGPGIELAPGGEFESFRTWILVQDSTERERRGLAVRRMYRTIAPWATENPLMMHVRSADPDAVRLAIDQCVEVGFEMVILTFGSGFSIEDESPANLQRWKDLAGYAHARGIELGGYSLLSSRRIGDEHDVISAETGRPGGAKFGNAPCLEGAWGRDYFRKLYAFYDSTGFDLLEHDGSYPGDVCASTTHPGHAGLADSQWQQRQRIVDFYRWCRGRGVYLNVPDWYFLNGSNKCGMGYRETNWSLPRERQILLGRQNIFDGTWGKTPSMGWMFVPLTEYHGGGGAATLEPLSEHLEAYGAHFANNLAAGVQACWRGPRLFDSPATRDLVAGWVAFFKEHRAILESDVVHLRRADGQRLDALLHVNPGLSERAFLAVWNPTDAAASEEFEVPLYYAGLTGSVVVHRGAGFTSGTGTTVVLDREYRARIRVEVPAHGFGWWVFEGPDGAAQRR
ncbi:MAG TPA: alpha-galactosidase [Planctomycetota bacterium]